jgi:uncharacterized protein YkwD
MTRTFIKKAIILTIGAALSINMLAGCRGSLDRLTDDSVITETLEYVIPNTDGGVGAALVRTATGETTVVYGDVTRESDGKIFVTSKDTGERIEISETDLLPEVEKEITTTIKTSDGTSVKVEGPVVKSPDGTTTVIDTKTGTSYILAESTSTKTTTTKTTTRPSEPTKVTSVSEETTTTPTTTVKEPKPTTVATTTVKETTVKPTSNPTTQATTTVAPTTAPTTQATTTAPAPESEPDEMPMPGPTAMPSYTPQEFKDEMFRLVNETRVANGLSPLGRGPDIIWQGADMRARELAIKFSHFRPDGTTPGTLYAELGSTVGYGMENIAYNTRITADAAVILNQFMTSPAGHGEVILTPDSELRSGTMTVGYYFGRNEATAEINKTVFAVVNIH